METLAPRIWALVHRSTQGAHEVFELATPRVSIGRAPGCEVTLADPRVSRRHASIELVEDQHLLRDAGSSNGTFLNGFRVTRERAFALREGDVIEVGDTALVFGQKGDIAAPARGLVTTGLSAPLPDLVHDGRASLGEAKLQAFESELAATFDRLGRVAGLERAVAMTAAELLLDTVALFLRGERPDPARTAPPAAAGERLLRLLCAWPRREVAAPLEALAARAHATGEGQLVHALGALEPAHLGGTDVHEVQSLAAAPFVATSAPGGVLAGTRTGDEPLDRRSLAVLAAIAETTARLLDAHERDRSDTRLGFRL